LYLGLFLSSIIDLIHQSEYRLRLFSGLTFIISFFPILLVLNCFFIFLFKRWLGPVGTFYGSVLLFTLLLIFVFAELVIILQTYSYAFIDFGRWFFCLELLDSHLAFCCDGLASEPAFIPFWYIGSENLTQLLLFRGLLPADIRFMHYYKEIPIELAAWHSEVCNWTYYSKASFRKLRPEVQFFMNTNASIDTLRERVAMINLRPWQGGAYPGSDMARRRMVFFLLHYGEGGACTPFKYFPAKCKYYQGMEIISRISPISPIAPSYFDCVD
jgi:hypothetical protein